MTVTNWFILFAICIVLGTKVVSCIRHNMICEIDSKAPIKVVDLFVAAIVGAVPLIQILAAILSVIGFVICVLIECAAYKKGFFNKNLFGGDDDE